MDECRLLAGLGIAVIGGLVLAGGFHYIVEKAINLPPKKPGVPRIPPWLTGVVERLLFFFYIVEAGGKVDDVGTAMIAWLALKLGANWNRRSLAKDDTVPTRTLLALLTGAISLAVAFLGARVAVGCVLR